MPSPPTPPSAALEADSRAAGQWLQRGERPADHGTFHVVIDAPSSCSASSLQTSGRRVAKMAAVAALLALFALVVVAWQGMEGQATGLVSTELQETESLTTGQLQFAPYITSDIGIRDPEGRKFKFDSAANVIRLNSGDDISFSVMSPARSDSNNNFENTEFVALKGGDVGYLRHAGYVTHLTPWDEYVAQTAPNGNLAYDYAWQFIPAGENQFKIKNMYGGGYWLGYNAEGDDIRIVDSGEDGAMLFTIDGDPGPAPTNTTSPGTPAPDTPQTTEPSSEDKWPFPSYPLTEAEWVEWEKQNNVPPPCKPKYEEEPGPHGEAIRTYYADCSEYARETGVMLAGREGGAVTDLIRMKPPVGGVAGLAAAVGKGKQLERGEAAEKQARPVIDNVLVSKGGAEVEGEGEGESSEGAHNLKSVAGGLAGEIAALKGKVAEAQTSLGAEEARLKAMIARGAELKKQLVTGVPKGPAADEPGEAGNLNMEAQEEDSGLGQLGSNLKLKPLPVVRDSWP